MGEMESINKGVAGDGDIGGGGSGVNVGGSDLAGLISGVRLDGPSPLDPSDTSPSLTSLAFRLPLPELFLGLPAPLTPLTRCLIEQPTPHTEHQTQAPRSTSPYRSMTRRRHVLPRFFQLVQGGLADLALRHEESSFVSASLASRYTMNVSPALLMLYIICKCWYYKQKKNTNKPNPRF